MTPTNTPGTSPRLLATAYAHPQFPVLRHCGCANCLVLRRLFFYSVCCSWPGCQQEQHYCACGDMSYGFYDCSHAPWWLVETLFQRALSRQFDAQSCNGFFIGQSR